MQEKNRRRSQRTLYMFVLSLIAAGMIFMSTFVAFAVGQNGNEAVICASTLEENAMLTLQSDTVLRMDVERTLKSIQGTNYMLFIEGSNTLTIDSDDCAINVYALTAEEGSNLTVKCRGKEGYSIQTNDSFTFAGANLNIDAYYGIKSRMGNIIVAASESATISARKGYAVLVESNDKKYTVSGAEVTLIEKKETLLASELADHADIVLKDDTILEMDVEKTLHSISGEEYQLVIEGPNTLTFDTNRSAIYVQELDVHTDLTINSSCDNEYSIRVKYDFNFSSDNLIVDAVFGIKSDEGDIVIDAVNHVEVYAEKGANIVSEGGSVYIYGQIIWIKNKMNGKDGVGREHGIYASDGVNITGSGVNNIVILGIYGIESGTSIQLNGNFTIDSYLDGLRARMGIDIDGYLAIESTHRLHYEKFFEEYVYGIYCADGPISMKGSKLRVVAEYGIKAKGNITVNCEEIDVTATLRTGVTSSAGKVTLDADKIRITATFERFKEYQDESDIPGFFGNEWKYGRVVAGDAVQISSQDCDIKGPTPVFADKSGRLSGNIRLFASGEEAGLKVFSGPLTLDGDIGIYVEVENDHVTGIYAKQMKATGTGLYVTSTKGIYCMNDIDLNCDTISIHATAGDGILTLKGDVSIDGDTLSIETAFDKEDLWDGGDCIAINAITGVRLDCASAEIYAPVGIQVSEGDVYLNGCSMIGVSQKGVYAENGDIYINGYTRIAMLSGGDYPLRSEKKRIVVSPSLTMNAPIDGKIQSGPGMVLDSEGNIPERVEFGSYVNDVSFNIDTPVGYNLIYTSGRIVRDLTEGLHVKNITWYCNNEKMELKSDGFNGAGSVHEYKAGNRYKAEILLETDSQYLLGYGYNSDDTLKKPVVVNGEEPASIGYMNTGREIYVTYDFGTCPTGFYKLDLDVKAPMDGQTPSTSVTSGDSGYGVRGNHVTWMVSDDGIDYNPMSANDSFVGGKFYQVIMLVNTQNRNDYAFSWQTDANGNLALRYKNYAYVNGAKARVEQVDGEDPLHAVEVIYDFGICNSTVIRKVTIDNLAEPYPGESPTYTANIRGTGYHLESGEAWNNVYYNKQYVDRLYKKNGIIWYDEDYNLVYADDTFKTGKTYRVKICLDADFQNGYQFDWDNELEYGETRVTGTVNGNEATVTPETTNSMWNHYVEYLFTCGKSDVSTVHILGLAEPKGDECPDTEVLMGDPDLYELADGDGIVWYHGEEAMGPEDRFAAGEIYSVVLRIVPVQSVGLNVCEFAEPMEVLINEDENTEIADMTVTSDYLEIRYEFRNPASEPDANVVPVTGVEIDEAIAVGVGQTVTPSWIVYPADATDKTVWFLSSNKAIAVVDAATGEITGVADGTAMIRITSENGQYSDVCVVTVGCAHVPASVEHENYLKSAGTCQTKAVYYKSCSVCGAALTEEATFESAEFAGHTEVIDPAVPATCKDTGLTEGKHCSVCSAVIQKQIVTPRIGEHKYVDGVCTVCGEKDSTVPPAISILSDAVSGGPKVSWNAVDGAKQYEVYRATSKSGTYSLVETTTGTSYIDASAKAGTRYYYKVISVNVLGVKSKDSNIVNRLGDLACPTVTVGNDAASGNIKLSWNAVEGAEKYEIYRATSKNGTYTRIYSGTNTSVTNTKNVEVGKTYYYKVKALHSNANANSAFSSVKSRTCDLARPVVTVSTTSAGKPNVSWKAVEGAVKYEIYRAESKNGTYTRIYSGTSTSVTNTKNVESGKTYYYKVKAIYSSSAANSADSEVVSSTSNLSSPVVTVTNVESSGKIKVNWDAVDGAAKYEVYRATSKSGTYKKLITTTKTSVTNTSTEAGKTYYYKVRAIHTDGVTSSNDSSVVSRTCDLARPTVTVSNVESSGKIKVSWNAIEGAVKYEIYRADSKDGTYSRIYSGTSTSVTNTKNLEAGKTYYYKVRAIHGTSAANSAYSEVKSRMCDLARPVVTLSVTSAGKPKVSWDKVEGAAKYEIYRATSKSGTYTCIYSGTSTSVTNTKNVTKGKTYYYKVKAIHTNSSANSSYSSVKSIAAK